MPSGGQGAPVALFIAASAEGVEGSLRGVLCRADPAQVTGRTLQTRQSFLKRNRREFSGVRFVFWNLRFREIE